MVYHVKRLVSVFTLCLIAIVVQAQTGSEAGSESATAGAAQAGEAVETFHATLIDTLKTATHSGRELLLQPQISGLFDVQRIAAISLGRTWRNLPADQQTTFISLLTTLIVATYADRFDNYSGQQFVTDEIKPVKSGFVVQTRLMREAEEDVSLHYFLRDGRIFNVVADGVSDLSLRRADYNSIIKNEGYEQLIEHIEEKIALARSDQ